ncbi:homoserine dehydrogenase [Dyella sp.]|uniref:homoserine dehydrogenase n=1 Tax=Dyella sp. TaxID=1869338 RepID=UPI002B45BDB9|nr:homoserine dehydrogenase [Dyella sp.]HKT26544.1 homoserine dehydrogenase [Dyella sp.]
MKSIAHLSPNPEPFWSRSQLHPASPIPPRQQLSLGLIGPGRVGNALLNQLRSNQLRLIERTGVQLRLHGVASSKKMWMYETDAMQQWHPGNESHPVDLEAFVRHMRSAGTQVMLIDCTASDVVVEHYEQWMQNGIHIVTPNKLAGSGPLDRWQRIQRAGNSAHFRQEATVCAGLPVVQTLRDFIDTGDELLSIEGMFSGTLAWLCHHYDGSRSFSALLRDAHALAYTEPDPREDLSGMDVARKLIILAREAGLSMSLDDVQVQNLVPDRLGEVSTESFFSNMEELDAMMAEKLAEARAQGGILRHVGRLDSKGHGSVGLCILPPEHTFAHTSATDNVIQFDTHRYHDNPMKIQGPGAGPEVTAGGIFADLLRIASSLPRQ